MVQAASHAGLKNRLRPPAEKSQPVSKRWGKTPLPAGIEILEAPDTVIATVGVVKEEPVAAAVPVEGEAVTEPEVIGKGKKEDEEGPAEEEKK